MQIGDKVKRVCETLGDPYESGSTIKEYRKALDGVVVYIHPEGRYYVVDFGQGLRESFIMREINDAKQAKDRMTYLQRKNAHICVYCGVAPATRRGDTWLASCAVCRERERVRRRKYRAEGYVI